MTEPARTAGYVRIRPDVYTSRRYAFTPSFYPVLVTPTHARRPMFTSCISALACRSCAHSLVYICPAFVFVTSRNIASSKMVNLESVSNDDELGDELRSA